jgi:hypothetical protein
MTPDMFSPPLSSFWDHFKDPKKRQGNELLKTFVATDLNTTT